MLEVPGSILVASEEKLVYVHASLRIICRDDMNIVHSPSDRDVNWMPPVKGQSSYVQVKKPYIGNLNGYL